MLLPDLLHLLENTFDRKRISANLNLKGRVQCFSMQVVMNKCFLLSSEKKLVQIRLVVFEKKCKNLAL